MTSKIVASSDPSPSAVCPFCKGKHRRTLMAATLGALSILKTPPGCTHHLQPNARPTTQQTPCDPIARMASFPLARELRSKTSGRSDQPKSFQHMHPAAIAPRPMSGVALPPTHSRLQAPLPRRHCPSPVSGRNYPTDVILVAAGLIVHSSLSSPITVVGMAIGILRGAGTSVAQSRRGWSLACFSCRVSG